MRIARIDSFPVTSILLIAAGLTQASCGAHSPATPPAAAAPKIGPRDWTLLVYMAADDDLESAAIATLEEMGTVGSSDHVNVVVQIDRAAADRSGHGFKRAPLMNLPDFSSTKRVLVKPGSLVELADLGETNTGDATTLGAFVTWGIKTFPASKTALVIWDHGGATAGAAWDTSDDDKPLSVVAMHRGLMTGLAGAGREKLDMLGFDACLMSNLGVVYELRNVADVIVASEEVEPAHGWPYIPIITAMAGAPKARDLAKSIVTSFDAECRAQKTIAMCTLAAFDASKLSAVADSIDDLAFALHGVMLSTNDWTKVARARDATEEYGASPGEESPYGTIDAVDLADHALALFADKTNHVKPALDAATIAAMHGTGRPDAHGLSITFAKQGDAVLPGDAALELAAHSRWQSFLTSYFAHEEGDTKAPSVSNPVAVANPKGGFRVSATVESADDLDQAYGVVALPLSGGGLSVVALRALDAGDASFSWDGTLPAISDGQNAAPATLFMQPQYADDADDGATVRVVSTRAKLLPNGDATHTVDVVVYLSVLGDGSASIHGVYKLAANGPANEVDFGEHDLLRPSVMVLDTKGIASWVDSKDGVTLRHAEHFEMKNSHAAAGTYAVGLYVTDLSGNTNAVTTKVTVAE